MNHLLHIKKEEQKSIDAALQVLKEGGLIVFPSDTVYGLLVDALNEKAVSKLIAFKNRPPGKPISVFVADFDMLKKHAFYNEKEEKLFQSLLPGPFTIILKSKQKVSPLLESEKKTLGLRLPDFPLVRELVRQFGRPVTATSANISGRKPHYSIQPFVSELSKQKKELIDLIVDAGDLPRNKPSTIIDLTQQHMRIVRKGEIQFKDSKTFTSGSARETQKIAEFLLQKNKHRSLSKPLVFILEGDVGSGKTIFTKGIGKSLTINDIISPTYVIYYEYKIPLSPSHKLFHFDLYNIESEEEFNHLGIEKNIKPGNIFVFEWGEKAGPVIDKLKKLTDIIHVRITYINEKEREIKVDQ